MFVGERANESDTVLGVDNAKSGICSMYYIGSERCELDTYRGNIIENRGYLYVYWRASEANNETLTGVTQSKIGDVSLFILTSKRSQRDSIRGG